MMGRQGRAWQVAWLTLSVSGISRCHGRRDCALIPCLGLVDKWKVDDSQVECIARMRAGHPRTALTLRRPHQLCWCAIRKVWAQPCSQGGLASDTSLTCGGEFRASEEANRLPWALERYRVPTLCIPCAEPAGFLCVAAGHAIAWQTEVARTGRGRPPGRGAPERGCVKGRGAVLKTLSYTFRNIFAIL